MTVTGGGRGCDWDEKVRDGAGAEIVGMVCGVHGLDVGGCEMGLWWNAATRAHP